MNKKIILLLSILAILLIAGCIGNQSNQGSREVRNIPLTYEEHVEYSPGGCYPNTGCWTNENIHIKNTDAVGGTFEIILYGNPLPSGSYKNGQESFPRYIDAGSSIVFVAGSFPTQVSVKFNKKIPQITSYRNI